MATKKQRTLTDRLKYLGFQVSARLCNHRSTDGAHIHKMHFGIYGHGMRKNLTQDEVEPFIQNGSLTRSNHLLV